MDAPHIQRAACAALRAVRKGELIMPPDQMGRALDIVQRVAAANGRTVDEILYWYDPDPRIGNEPGPTFESTIIDLDEEERYAATVIKHAMMIRSAAVVAADPSLEPTIWSVAHDRAIVDIAASRAARGKTA